MVQAGQNRHIGLQICQTIKKATSGNPEVAL